MHWWKFLLLLLNKIRFFKKERLVLSLNEEEVFALIFSVTQRLSSEQEPDLSILKKKFVGIVKQDFFCVSKKVSHPQSFLPRVTGRLKKNKQGIVLHLTYQLFPLTRVLFGLFSLACFMISAFSYIKTQSFTTLFICFSSLLLAYFVAKANFLLHCRDIKAVIVEELYL